jgi:TorA maturation chaperone TorD
MTQAMPTPPAPPAAKPAKPGGKTPATGNTASPPLSRDDQARADLYALIAHLLMQAPDAELLAELAAASTLAPQMPDTPLDLAWQELTRAAGQTDAAAAQGEYDALFKGTGTPPLSPCASRYLSADMMNKPLATLRATLDALELERQPAADEPIDHLGALCEVMRVMIAGLGTVPRRPLAEQAAFFTMQIAPWQARCLNDIRNMPGAHFYGHVADVAEAFFDIEALASEPAQAGSQER